MPSTPERRCLIAGSWGGRGHTTTDNARTQGRFGPTQFLLLLLPTLPLPDRLLVVIDDSPTKRYGPKVEGTDIHRSPTPGPTDQKYLYWTPAVDLDCSPDEE